MADPNTIQQVADHAGSIGSLITYYAPGALATVSPIAAYFVKKYVQPIYDALIALPDLLKEQNDLLKTANAQREKKS